MLSFKTFRDINDLATHKGLKNCLTIEDLKVMYSKYGVPQNLKESIETMNKFIKECFDSNTGKRYEEKTSNGGID